MVNIGSGRSSNVRLPAVTPARKGQGRGDGESSRRKTAGQIKALDRQKDRSGNGRFGREVWLGKRQVSGWSGRLACDSVVQAAVRVGRVGLHSRRSVVVDSCLRVCDNIGEYDGQRSLPTA